MGTVYVFFADGFEEVEAFTSVDVMRRAGLNVEMVTVTPDEIVTGAHDVPVLCDKNIVNCDFYDADLVLLPSIMSTTVKANSIAAPGPLAVMMLPSLSTGAPVKSAPSRYCSKPG